MKTTLTIVAGLIVIGALLLWQMDVPGTEEVLETEEQTEARSVSVADTETIAASARDIVSGGAYEVDPTRSTITWAGKKPLLEGYINSGTLGITGGEIMVVENETATGEFTIDMNTLSVGSTPTKPGSESMLEEHLKGENWFAVDTYPEASFMIDAVTARPDSEETYIYDVAGTLTMKDVEGVLAFPAMIYLDDEGYLRAEASFSFDRTKWGITAGSGSFFDSLADNVIDDMVQLSFSIVAEDK